MRLNRKAHKGRTQSPRGGKVLKHDSLVTQRFDLTPMAVRKHGGEGTMGGGGATRP